jgi:deoxyribose-phosphate aldolase
MSEYLPVKASGGIGDYETARELIEAGADRIGASGGVDILAGAPE